MLTFPDPPAAPPTERLLFSPNAWINGRVEQSTLSTFLECLDRIRSSGEDLILELNTQGGDADIAQRIAHEVRLFLRYFEDRGYVVGKTFVFSAGVTIMAAFPRTNRYLTEDTTLLIHERHVDKELSLKGPLKANMQIIREQIALLETAQRLENEGFAEFVSGSSMSLDEIIAHAETNCYMTAEDALQRGLIHSILR